MELIKEHEHIEHILDGFRDVLGVDFKSYYNHVYRIFNLLELLTPRRLSDAELEKFAIASAYHDIGIWTENSLDYLSPSAGLASEYLKSIDREDWIDEVVATIVWHHKITEYKGPYREAVNLFRKADWIDVSRGFRSFGVRRIEIVHLYSEFPDAGFHRFLLKKGFQYAMKHPLRPLPMFRR